MKRSKYHNIIFGRFALVAILIIAQILLNSVFWHHLETYYFAFRTVTTVSEVLLLLFVINKHEPASYKLPWVLAILFFSFSGMLMYLLLGVPRHSRAVKRKFAAAEKNNELYLNAGDKYLSPDGFDGASDEFAEISRYVYNASRQPAYDDTLSFYIPTGEKFFDLLEEKLKNAERYIFLEYFIIGEGEVWNSLHEILKQNVKRGVKVYLLYDDVGSIGKIPSHFDEKLRKEGINAYRFNPFVPVVSGVLNNRDHRKIAVIDGEISFTGGINIADEYANITKPYGRWKDGGVMLEGEATDSFVLAFIGMYNLYARKRLRPEDFLVKHPERAPGCRCGYVQPFCDGPKPFNDKNTAQNVYTQMIFAAKKYIYITTPYLIVDYSMIEALCVCAERGVDVRILTPHIPDKKSIFAMTRSAYMPLIKSGVKIYEYGDGFVHAKSVVFDDRVAVTGTVNFDYRSFVHHYEDGVLLCDNDTVTDIRDDFLATVSACGILQTEKTAKLKFIDKILKSLISIFAPLL